MSSLRPDIYTLTTIRKLSASSVRTHASSTQSSGRGGPAARTQVIVENTYRTEPDVKFPVRKVREIIKDVLESRLEKGRYKPEDSNELAKELSEVIKSRVKALQVPRYKLVCFVHLGTGKKSEVHASSQCIWNPDIDSYADFTFTNQQMFAVGIVWGMYYE
ncbi:dynein light chain Tctex-type 5-B-like [Branchiostoma lanceolatum]|uniref:TCTEX1D1 protein n=1 Tax=Branchiostoma lanceolatum TaxID=7740 RepID=A0A8J9YVV5_BRALA|nr:TCTEX1D1 [Branchiostoma lanceolatum]